VSLKYTTSHMFHACKHYIIKFEHYVKTDALCTIFSFGRRRRILFRFYVDGGRCFDRGKSIFHRMVYKVFYLNFVFRRDLFLGQISHLTSKIKAVWYIFWWHEIGRKWRKIMLPYSKKKLIFWTNYVSTIYKWIQMLIVSILNSLRTQHVVLHKLLDDNHFIVI
jgi:hypothetical protein